MFKILSSQPKTTRDGKLYCRGRTRICKRASLILYTSKKINKNMVSHIPTYDIFTPFVYLAEQIIILYSASARAALHGAEHETRMYTRKMKR